MNANLWVTMYQFLKTLAKARSDLGRGSPEEWPDQWREILPMFIKLFNTEEREMSKIDVNIEDTQMILDKVICHNNHNCCYYNRPYFTESHLEINFDIIMNANS